MASIPKWTIEFDPAAQRELDRLDRPVARRISKFLHEQVSQLDNPHKIGERLTGALSDFWNTASETTALSAHSSTTGYLFSVSA